MTTNAWSSHALAAWQRVCGLACAKALLVCGFALASVAHAQTAAPAGAAANAIRGVSAAQQGGADVVRIELSQPISAVPAGFSVQQPARIALDFPGAVNELGASNVPVDRGNVRSVSVVQAGDRTRVVLNLRSASNYKAEVRGNVVLVTLDAAPGAVAQAAAPAAAPAAAAPAPAQPSFAEARSAQTLPLRDLDFRRTADGAARVVVELPNNQVGVDIRNQGPNLVVEFLKSSLPEGLRRRLDVTDFGTPVRSVTTTAVGDRVRMLIEPTGSWEHSAYQSDNQFVVEVRPQKVDPNKLVAGQGYRGERLSLNFQNIDVRALLQVIADFTNFNVITSDSVTGNVTLRLKDVPWDQALEIILQTKGLGVRKNGNVLWVAPRAEIAAREKLELESRASLESLEPVRTQAFQLNYAKATDIASQLLGATPGGGVGGGVAVPAIPGAAAAASARFLTPRGSVIAEPRTNQVFVTDIPAKLEDVAGLIAKLDIPQRQVLIEARIVEASDTFGRSLGVKLGSSDLRLDSGGFGRGGGGRIVLGGSYDAISAATGQPAAAAVGGATGTGGSSNANFVNLPAVGQGGYTPATFAVSLFSSAANRFLNLELSALEADGKGKLVSSPRIVTADKTKARIEQGTEFPYQQATASGATAVAFRRATLKLEVTPQITPEGNIILDLDINKDSRGETTAAGIAINTKQIKTQVLVENGGTVVIGGIFELTENDSESKVPVLGDIPVAGNLFKSRQRNTSKQEMLVFITPKMIADRGIGR